MPNPHPHSDPRLIIALDVPSALEGLALAEKLGDTVSFYKIGLGMLTGGGLALAIELKEMGKRVFLDMKLFDIPATVEKATRGLAQYDLDFLTVHGDPHVVRAAVAGRGASATKILAVTILTAMERDDLDECLIKSGKLHDLVVERARNAFRAGADGVIASPQESALIRALPEAEGKLIVTPGVRMPEGEKGDQKRVATPAQAIAEGSDYLVVGRPVWQASAPKIAARRIVENMAEAKAINSRFH